MSSLLLLNRWPVDSNEQYLPALEQKECPISFILSECPILDLSTENIRTRRCRMRTLHGYESYALIQ